MAAVRLLLAGTLEVATQRQASQRWSSEQAYPDCGKMCLLKHEERPIVVRTGSTFENTTNPRLTAPGMSPGFFSPQRPVLKLGTHGYSPSVLNKIVQAAGQAKSRINWPPRFLGVVGEISISGRHVNRLAGEIRHRTEGETGSRNRKRYIHHRARRSPPLPLPNWW